MKDNAKPSRLSTSPVTETGKGLAAGQIGLFTAIVIGVSTIAPSYVVASTLGPTAEAVGTHLPAIFIIGFIPMFLVALGYRELNRAMPDNGTTFTWVWKAFGPRAGWMGGWGMLAANIIVLSNLAGVAVDFFYLFLAQATGQEQLADLASNPWINVATCLVFMLGATWISVRGLHAASLVQYLLVGFQVLVLLWFTIAALDKAAPAVQFSPEWFNPLGIDSFSAMAVGLSLSIFAFWGWDVCLSMNEETKNGERTSGLAAGFTAVIVLAVYLLTSVSATVFAGVGDSGLGLANPENIGNVFAALAGPVMGPAAILLSLATLASCAASLQSTMISPARSMLAMGHHGALPPVFTRIHPKFGTPAFATIVAAVVSTAFYAMMRFVSTNVLNDTILALGMMICFYYGITAFACVWFFRYTLLASARNFFIRAVAPLLGGLALVAVFLQTTVDSLDPEYGSGTHVAGLGLVFVVGVGILVLGAVFLAGARKRRAGFYESRPETRYIKQENS
ncbi:APC family permease [Glutamicibacter protophormiae]|uniref:Amino acid transporter n=1 Tax=Glutamicibacter protophormiae TaxID=37930 RepID=A0ABS4XLX3_GLUPR|nr:APC family permease [Glutamicibacter protophormiae]MBP2397462.1 amino acid transporter [Glutamicibacter protophormiae]GGL79048.1 amino acid transporter [Glutamicibacter protophormiae]